MQVWNNMTWGDHEFWVNFASRFTVKTPYLFPFKQNYINVNVKSLQMKNQHNSSYLP